MSPASSLLLQVHRVFPHGLAAQEGTIEKGDEVLSINGHTLRDVTHADATATLRQTRALRLAVVVVCKRPEAQGLEAGEASSGTPNNSSMSQPEAGSTGEERQAHLGTLVHDWGGGVASAPGVFRRCCAVGFTPSMSHPRSPFPGDTMVARVTVQRST